MHSPAWGVSLRKGQHEALISYETHQKIIDRLDQRVYAPTRKDIRHDFPLRGVVACHCCSTPLTSGWSKGKYKKYAYYRCRKKGCDMYGKGIARSQLERDFEAFLKAVQPTEQLSTMAGKMFQRIWNIMSGQSGDIKEALKVQLREADQKIDKLVDMAASASSARVIAAYEKKIEEAELSKLDIAEKLENPGRTKHTYEELFELALKFISSPCKIWETARFEMRRIILRLVFSDHLSYCKDKGLLNSDLSMPFKALDAFSEV